MALTKSITIENTPDSVVVYPDAYIRVSRILGDKGLIDIRVDSFSHSGGFLVKREVFQMVPDMDSGNFIKQAYLYLKTLPDFSSAKDC